MAHGFQYLLHWRVIFYIEFASRTTKSILKIEENILVLENWRKYFSALKFTTIWVYNKKKGSFSQKKKKEKGRFAIEMFGLSKNLGVKVSSGATIKITHSQSPPKKVTRWLLPDPPQNLNGHTLCLPFSSFTGAIETQSCGEYGLRRPRRDEQANSGPQVHAQVQERPTETETRIRRQTRTFKTGPKAGAGTAAAAEA